jgi:hypothetical protein
MMTNDNHFTVLGFTTATGEPIMGAVIVAIKSIRPEYITVLSENQFGLSLLHAWIYLLPK